MKKSLFALILLMCCTLTYGQKGTLRGSVVDDTGLTLPGAAVILQGTTTGISTDFDGKYSLDLPAGVHTIEVSFVSFSKKTITGVEINEGEVTTLDIQLSTDAVLLEGEVVITAKQSRNTESALLSMQKKSANLLDGVSSQQFRKVGDSNAAAAIRRIPGVSIQGGKHVYVRGLGDRYTKTILNGMTIPGLDPDRNSVQMDIFPTATIDNIVVYKTFSPDLDGDFTGGMVDVVTKDFPEEKSFAIRYSAGFNPDMTLNDGYQTYEGSGTDLLGFDNGQRELPVGQSVQVPDATQNNPALTTITKRFTPVMSTTPGNQFFDQSFSVNGGNMKVKDDLTFGYNALLNYSLDYNYFDQVEQGFYLRFPEKDSYELEKEQQLRGSISQQDVLWSALATGAVKSKSSSATLNLFRTQGATSQAVDRVSTDFDQNVSTLLEDILMFSQRSLTNASLALKHRTESEVQLSWKNSYSISSLDDPDFRVSSLSVREDDPTWIYIGDGGKLERYWRYLDETNYSSRFDVEKALTYKNDESGKVKAGLALTTKQREFSILRYNFRYETNGESIPGTDNPDFFFQDENIWTVESQKGTVLSDSGVEPSNVYDAGQTVLAGYALHDYSFSRRLKAIYGVRAEQTTMTYTGIDQSGERRFADTETLNALNILPSVNTIYTLNEDMNLRASYNKSLARPSFREKSVAQIFDPISKTTFLGNIDLEQTTIDNVDLRWEFFPDRGEVISVSTFYKRFDGHIELAVFETAVDNIKPVNSGISQVFGAEFELRKTLDFMSDSVNIFKLGTNVTLVRSEMDMSTVRLPGATESELDIRNNSVREGESIGKFRQMAGQSPYLINAYISYANSTSDFEGNVSYNVQGKTLSFVGLGLVPDVYAQPVHQVNMRVAKKMGKSKRSTLSLRANNLLGQERVLNYESFRAQDQIYSRFYDGRDFIIGYAYSIR